MSARHLNSTLAVGCISIAVLACATDEPLSPSPMISGETASATLVASPLVTGLQGASGSAIGPGGALFVTEGAVGRLSRVDLKTGAVTTHASGLPASLIGIGGAIDVEFIGQTPYVLVTLVGSDLGGSSVVGIYRIDGPNAFTIIADIGAFNLANPPATQFDVPTGLQYSMEHWRGGFLVADGHLNRVLYVTLDGEISVFRAFGNIVPTGLAVRGNTIYMAEAGPTPHLPEDGRVVSFGPTSAGVTELASGGRLLVDVEIGRGNTLFALGQGDWAGAGPGAPANPFTGALYEVNANGTLTELLGGLNLPTSLELVGTTAYIVTLSGEVMVVEGVGEPPFGRR